MKTINTPRAPIDIQFVRSLRRMLGCCLCFGIVSTANAQTIAWQENWESPEAQDCWVADFGYWEIGVPTSGPGSAHGGTNVAATVLNGDYTDNRESRLVSCPVSVPAVGLNPRLRFWHWWNFNADDYGQVQISTNNGASWIPLSPKYGYSPPDYQSHSDLEWTRGWLDLTPYAGKTVRLGLYFYSNNSGGGSADVAPGWYVDEIVIESGPPPIFVAPESFEEPSAADRWTVDFGVWEIGTPGSGPENAHGGSNCLATILSGNYYDNRSSRISGQPFAVPETNPRLRFWHWWNFSADDYGQVQISTNNGASWEPLSLKYGYTPPDYQAHSDLRWTRATLDLTPYAGKTVRLAFYFYSNNSGGGSADVAAGWYVDEIIIESGPPPDFVTPESFEEASAAERWTADFGTWEIGAPTSGPGSAHGGSNCLATVLSADYYDNRSSRITSQPFTVPPTNPRLRFWHWWNFNADDYGQVQISTNNGASWEALSPKYGYSPPDYQAHSDLRWTRGWLDLTPYAGKMVHLAFYFYSNNSGGGSADVAPGWYVDEIVIESGPLATMITPDSFEDFEALNRWITDFGTWEIGAPTSGPGSAHGGSNCLATILSGNYYDNRSSRISSQTLLLPPATTNPRLRFWHWWSFSAEDYGQLQISTNNGVSWDILATYTTSSPWTQPQISLARYGGLPARLGFYFYSNNSGGGSADVAPGWYIDEVRLLHDFAALLLTSPVVRTQDTACISLGIAASSAPSLVSFTLQAPTGHLGGPSLHMEGCWNGGLTPLSGSQWAVSLTNNCALTPMGVTTVGSACFTAISEQSAFVPLTIENLQGPPLPRHAFGSRAVTIAEQPLLDTWREANGQRMVTTFGLPNTGYLIRYTNMLVCEASSPEGGCVVDASKWPVGMTNLVPATMWLSQPVTGDLSNAPTLFLRAQSQEEAGITINDPFP